MNGALNRRQLEHVNPWRKCNDQEKLGRFLRFAPVRRRGTEMRSGTNPYCVTWHYPPNWGSGLWVFMEGAKR